MFKPFFTRIGGVSITLGGNTVLIDEQNNKEDQTGEILEPWKCEKIISSVENYAVIEGTPENGITVVVLEHLFKEGKMKTVNPCSDRHGVKKFSAKNDIYVVLEKDIYRRIFVICHRIFHPTRRTFWDAGIAEKIPTEKPAEKSIEEPKEPFGQRLELEQFKTRTSVGNNGSEEAQASA